MGGGVRVDVVRVREAAGFAFDKADEIERQLTGLDRTVGAELLIDGWQGSAASAYTESWVEWKAAAESIIAALRESGTGLLATANSYETTDRSNATALGHVELDLS